MAKNKIYPFAVASIRSMENRLLTKQKLMQMADAKDIAEALLPEFKGLRFPPEKFQDEQHHILEIQHIFPAEAFIICLIDPQELRLGETGKLMLRRIKAISLDR